MSVINPVKKDVIDEIDLKERIGSRMLGLRKPIRTQAVVTDFELTDVIEGYHPIIGDNTDIYVVKHDYNESDLTHFAVQRLYYHTHALNGNTTPVGVLVLEHELIKKVGPSEEIFKGFYEFFNKTLMESYSFFGQYLIDGQIDINHGHPDLEHVQVEKLLSTHYERRGDLIINVMKIAGAGIDMSGFLPKYLGFKTGIEMALKFGQKPDLIKQYFFGFNLNTISPSEFDPVDKYFSLKKIINRA